MESSLEAGDLSTLVPAAGSKELVPIGAVEPEDGARPAPYRLPSQHIGPRVVSGEAFSQEDVPNPWHIAERLPKGSRNLSPVLLSARGSKLISHAIAHHLDDTCQPAGGEVERNCGDEIRVSREDRRERLTTWLEV